MIYTKNNNFDYSTVNQSISYTFWTDSDPNLLNFKPKEMGLPFDEQYLINDVGYMLYSG